MDQSLRMSLIEFEKGEIEGGIQQTVLFPGRPAPLSECRLMNHTLPSLRIGCREGFDGGLPQTFQLEVYENDELKTKVSNAKPNFEIAYVPSGKTIH